MFRIGVRRIRAFLGGHLRYWGREQTLGSHADDELRGLVILKMVVNLQKEKTARLAQLIAAIMNLTLLRFLISQRVPGGCPRRFTETLISHRRDPCDSYKTRDFYEWRECMHLFHVSVTRAYSAQDCLECADICAGFFWRSGK